MRSFSAFGLDEKDMVPLTLGTLLYSSHSSPGSHSPDLGMQQSYAELR
jgi:hypothetical protein